LIKYPQKVGYIVYKREFDELIKNKDYPSSIFMWGDEYLSDKYATFVSKKLDIDNSMLKLYFDEYEFNIAKEYLSQSSLFGERNILYIKSDKRVLKKELDILLTLAKKDKNAHFIYQFVGEDRVAKQIERAFSKKIDAISVRFFKPNKKEAIERLLKISKKISLDIDEYALTHLYEIHNENLQLCENELEKLSILDKKINYNDIDKFVYGLGELNLDQFIELLLEKKDIKSELERVIYIEDIDEIRVINSITNYINRLFLFRIYITAHGTYNIVDILGYNLPSNIAQKLATQSSKIELKRYIKILSLLIEAQLKLKSSNIGDKKSYLISTLIKLQSYL